MAAVDPTTVARRASLIGFAALAFSACDKSAEREVKGLKIQVQDRYGAKDWVKGYEIAQKGLALARKALGDKNPDTLYFAQAVSEMALNAHNVSGTMRGLKVELELRSRAGQSEKKLQSRRTLLIKLAEEGGDKSTAIEETVAVARGIAMSQGKDPQPTYRTETPYPPDLFRQHIEGDVEMTFNLDPNGTPSAVRVVKATPPNVFDTAAVESLKKWRFTPVLENDMPVSSTGHHFTLAFRMAR